MSKAAAAFRTISEVAEELDVPKHVLRFWELKFAQLKPMKRGGGRRYYRPEDLDLLRGIRHLLHADGYTIKGVQKILREQGVDAAKTAALKSGADAEAVPTARRSKKRRRTPASGKSSLKHAAERETGRAKTKSVSRAAPSPAGLSPKSVKSVERVIKELKACRDILKSPQPVPFTTRSASVKPRRSRAAR